VYLSVHQILDVQIDGILELVGQVNQLRRGVHVIDVSQVFYEPESVLAKLAV
jgi:hypothetical protein